MKRRIPTEEEAQKVVKEYETKDAFLDGTIVYNDGNTVSQHLAEIEEAEQYYSYCKFIVNGPDPSD